MKNNKLTTFVSTLTLSLVLIVMCSFQLKVDEVAVVTTLSNSKVIDKPGLYFRWPWPVQDLVRMDTRKQLYEGREKQILTKDNISLLVKIFVAWSVDENAPLKFYSKVGEKVEDASKRLEPLIESKQQLVLHSYQLNDFLNSQAGASKIQQIEQELAQILNEVTQESYGVRIHKVALTKISLPEKNTVSVLDRMKQEQQFIASKIRSTAEKEARIKRNTANKQSAELLSQAEADSKQMADEIRVKSAELFSKYEKDQDFAAFLRQLDAIKEIMKTQTTAFLSPEIPPFDLFRKALNNEAKKE